MSFMATMKFCMFYIPFWWIGNSALTLLEDAGNKFNSRREYYRLFEHVSNYESNTIANMKSYKINSCMSTLKLWKGATLLFKEDGFLEFPTLKLPASSSAASAPLLVR